MQKRKILTSRKIGERIKNRRRDLGISQEQLAEILGVTYQQVQRYENGMNRLNVENIQVIADALSAPVSYFFEPDKPSMVSKEKASYTVPDEVKLLKYFRKIKDRSSRQTVIGVARLAAKAG